MANPPQGYVDFKTFSNPLTGPSSHYVPDGGAWITFLSWEALRGCILWYMKYNDYPLNKEGVFELIDDEWLVDILREAANWTSSHVYMLLDENVSIDLTTVGAFDAATYVGPFYPPTITTPSFIMWSIELTGGDSFFNVDDNRYVYKDHYEIDNLTGFSNDTSPISGSDLNSIGIARIRGDDNINNPDTLKLFLKGPSSINLAIMDSSRRYECFKSVQHLADWLFDESPGPGPEPGINNPFGFEYPEPGVETSFKNWTTPTLNKRVVFQNYSFAVPNFRLIKKVTK